MVRGARWARWIGAVLAATAFAAAQAETAVQPDASVGAALRSLAAHASDVFVGQVVSIKRRGGVVDVTFRVDQSVLGQQGGTLVLHEWAGLWPPGQQRYFLGQRAMVFLHPSASGLSSPVNGQEGVVPVLVQGTTAAPLADVRRLETRVLRQMGQPLGNDSVATVSLSDAETVVKGWQNPTFQEPVRHPLPAAYSTHPMCSAAGKPGLLHSRLVEGGVCEMVLQPSGTVTAMAPTATTSAGTTSTATPQIPAIVSRILASRARLAGGIAHAQ